MPRYEEASTHRKPADLFRRSLTFDLAAGGYWIASGPTEELRIKWIQPCWLVGYVSDERYVALADVMLEFQRDGRTEAIVRSTPRGAIIAQLAPGNYHVTLVIDGFGSKSVNMTVDPRQPYQFRLLSDCILGFVWPRAVKAGERSEFRVHAVEPYRLSLWRYGWQREMVRCCARVTAYSGSDWPDCGTIGVPRWLSLSQIR